MKKLVLAGLAFFLVAHTAHAQPGRYLVQLKNKEQNPYSLGDPAGFLSPRSVERRTRYNIPYDSTDLPVTPAYVDSLRAVPGITVLNISKWLNQVSVQATDAAALARIEQFPFVQSTAFVASRTERHTKLPETYQFKKGTVDGIQALTNTEGPFDYGVSAAQINMHNGQFLHNLGLQGQGMVVSLLDAGFYHYTTLQAFDSVNRTGRVLGTWDFVAREESVIEDHPHGMQCFSTIAANIPGVFVGTAPEARFYLFRTEDVSSEYPVEEHNWVCGAERVDSAGGDVISSSLGYSTFDNAALNHAYSDLDGDKTIAARGADLAAKKGILVLNSAGNEGANSWKFIVTPADGDSIIAVGAVDTKGDAASFSSFGPSADGRVKPDVASVGVGTVIQGTNNTIVSGNGTSFACPNLAGLATCLWQGFPEYGNLKIIEALRRSGHLFQTPNDRVGYGIPDMKKAVQLLLNDFATDSVTGCNTIQWTSKDAGSMRYEIERKKGGETSFTKIGTQSGTNALFQTHYYQFVDESLTAADGLTQYRIRQVLDTAAASFAAFYLDTLTVATTLACNTIPASEHGVQIVPNPVQNHFQVKIDNGAAIANLQLTIVNAIGQTAHTQQASKESGMAVITVQTAGLARGVYYLLVYDGKKRLAAKTFLKL